ncbi:MAG: hypothetical protein DYG92_05525 [Leptolyngbya sp. PLA1]|nr:hypothetical protein [Leptolyngbya sp. PLA1]
MSRVHTMTEASVKHATRCRFGLWALALAGVSAVSIASAPASAQFTADPTDALISGPTRVHPAVWSILHDRQERVHAWVFLTDKDVADVGSALVELEATYPARALARRSLRRTDPGLVDERDLPVAASYESAIRAVCPEVRATSRWLNAVSVSASREQIARLAELPFVRWVQPVRQGPATEPVSLEVEPPATYSDRDFYGRSSTQLAQIGLSNLHAMGFTAQGVVVGILDTGFRYDHAAFNQAGHPLQILAERDFIFDDNVTTDEAGDEPGQHGHGTLILGCIASYFPNELVGGAYDASVILCKTEDIRSETPAEEDYYVEALEFIELHGGDLATSSLSYSDWYTQANMNGVTAVTSIAVNIATSNGVHCCTAAGNAGNDADPQTSRLGAPADALAVITCGAVDIDGLTASFSSDGPTADGRLKPEVLARGVGTRTVATGNTTQFASASGTSLSTPLLAAAVACLVQAHPDWTAAQMRAALFATASDQVANGQPDPLFVRGHGVINAAAAAVPLCDADVNQDGNVDQDDVGYLINVVGGGENATGIDPDFNHDGNTDQDDIAALIGVVAGGDCP